MRKPKISEEDIFPIPGGSVLSPASVERQHEAVMLPRWRLKPRTKQPRTEFEKQRVEALGRNIKYLRERGEGRGGSGILQSLEGTWEPGAILPDGTLKPDARVLINIGETRYHATAVAGFTDDDLIPVTISGSSEQQAYENALIENLLRTDLSPRDRALALRTWMNQHEPPLSYQKAADALGQNKAWVQLALTPLTVDEDVAQIIDARPDTLMAAQRINLVRDNPQLRAQLIAAMKSGATFISLRPILQDYFDRQRAKKKSATEESEPVAGMERYGKGPSGPIVPRLDIPATLRTANYHASEALDAMEGVVGSMHKSYRDRIRAELKALESTMERISTLLSKR